MLLQGEIARRQSTPGHFSVNLKCCGMRRSEPGMTRRQRSRPDSRKRHRPRDFKPAIHRLEIDSRSYLLSRHSLGAATPELAQTPVACSAVGTGSQWARPCRSKDNAASRARYRARIECTGATSVLSNSGRTCMPTSPRRRSRCRSWASDRATRNTK